MLFKKAMSAMGCAKTPEFSPPHKPAVPKAIDIYQASMSVINSRRDIELVEDPISDALEQLVLERLVRTIILG